MNGQCSLHFELLFTVTCFKWLTEDLLKNDSPSKVRLSNSPAPKTARSRNAWTKVLKQKNFLYFLARAQTKVSLVQIGIKSKLWFLSFPYNWCYDVCFVTNTPLWCHNDVIHDELRVIEPHTRTKKIYNFHFMPKCLFSVSPQKTIIKCLILLSWFYLRMPNLNVIYDVPIAVTWDEINTLK